MTSEEMRVVAGATDNEMEALSQVLEAADLTLGIRIANWPDISRAISR
jgi:hypothetical protein